MPSSFKYLLISIIMVLSFSTKSITLVDFEKTPKTIANVKLLVNKFSREYLIKELREFVNCCRPNRMVGSEGHGQVASYLVNRIKQIDSQNEGVTHVDEFSPNVDHAIKMYRDDFQKEVASKYPKDHPIFLKWKGFTDSFTNELKKRENIKGKNVIWEKKGSLAPNEIIVIGAHFDTIANNQETMKVDEKSLMPGADDNGSGVAIGLKLIEIFSQLKTPKTIRIVFFDFEEMGFLGSHAFVQKYKKEFNDKNFLGYINLEMLGHDSNSKDLEKTTGNMRVYIRKDGETGHQKDIHLASRLTNVGHKMTPNVQFSIVDNSFNSSDHINFWQEGLPAVTFTQNWESDFNQTRYHTSNDFVETLNFSTYFASFQHIVGALVSYSFDIL